MVVDSSCRDVPKYMGEGVVLCSAPGALGGPYCINHINYSHSGLFLRRCALDVQCLKHVILFVDVTSFNDAVITYVMSQCCTCVGHMTISADVKMILKTITDKELTSLKDMARKLEPPPLTAKVSQEK